MVNALNIKTKAGYKNVEANLLPSKRKEYTYYFTGK